MLDLYEKIVATRQFDLKVKELVERGHRILYHSGVGQEAVPAGVCAQLRREDYVVPYHRGWGYMISKGMDMGRILAELMGRAGGYCKGKAGTHMACLELGILGKTGIVGAGLPVAVGAALSAKMKGSGQVVACFFGEGASNTGAFHEALNMAAVWRLPVVFVCENNLYDMYTPYLEVTSVANIADRASAYGMPGEVVDGQDVLAVYEAARRAVARARRGDGPSLLECKTYRWYGHFMADEHHYGGYRSVEEVEAWRARCPIRKLRDYAISKGIPARELDRVEERVRAKVEEAERFALGSPEPDPRAAFEDVYA
ncbi:MAG: thiamine pyrophosphate-dependent dehydrogenase E1 component subunit alpha [Candidatus Bathyarchaeia archaeon]